MQDGDWWISAWLYNQNTSYDTLGPISFAIEIDGDYRESIYQDYDIEVWRFDLSSDIASFTKIVNDASSWVSFDSQTNKTTISIPSTPGLTQNPLFIRYNTDK